MNDGIYELPGIDAAIDALYALEAALPVDRKAQFRTQPLTELIDQAMRIDNHDVCAIAQHLQTLVDDHLPAPLRPPNPNASAEESLRHLHRLRAAIDTLLMEIVPPAPAEVRTHLELRPPTKEPPSIAPPAHLFLFDAAAAVFAWLHGRQPAASPELAPPGTDTDQTTPLDLSRADDFALLASRIGGDEPLLLALAGAAAKLQPESARPDHAAELVFRLPPDRATPEHFASLVRSNLASQPREKRGDSPGVPTTPGSGPDDPEPDLLVQALSNGPKIIDPDLSDELGVDPTVIRHLARARRFVVIDDTLRLATASELMDVDAAATTAAVTVPRRPDGWWMTEEEALGIGLRPGDELEIRCGSGLADVIWSLDDPVRRVRIEIEDCPDPSEIMVTLDAVVPS